MKKGDAVVLIMKKMLFAGEDLDVKLSSMTQRERLSFWSWRMMICQQFP